MDLLIQIIIIVVIVLSILKRMKEVAGKGEELGAPPPVAPPVSPPMVERPLMPVQRVEEVEKTVKQAEPSGMLKELRELFQQELPEPAVEEVPLTPEEFPPVSEDILQPVSYREIVIPKKEPAPLLSLSFTGTEAAKGIVLSEILGPPVSLRKE